MDLEAAKRAQAAIARRGEVISLRRMRANTEIARADVKARVRGNDPSQLAPGITVGTRHVIVSGLDLEAAGFPVPPVKGDRIFLGMTLNIWTTIETVDPDHREYQGCFEITAAG